MYRKYLKRPLDFIVALIGLIVFSPLMIVIAILVRTKLGSPVIFKQPRPGLNEKVFALYKFRTMTDERDENGALLPDAQRLTPFGKWLRSTSLDELPELWNIIRGDMSLVGPRPLAVEYLPYYTETERIRHTVRPGLTGLAQVNGRNAVSWEERFRYDVSYVESISFVGDIRILLRTISCVIGREGVLVRGTAGVEDFHAYRARQTGGQTVNLIGNRILLRALEPEDMEMLRGTVNDPEIEKMVVGWSFPVSRAQQLEWYECVKKDRDHLRLAIEIKETGEAIGLATLGPIDWKNRKGFHGIKLKSDAPKGQGYATEAVLLIMKYAFEELQLNRLDGSILEYNIPSQRLYEKCGWKVEGRVRQSVFKGNGFHDEIIVGILRDEYFSLVGGKDGNA